MKELAGVRFRQAGKVYHFDANGIDVNVGDHVIAETARGIEYGIVAFAPKPFEDSLIPPDLKGILRLANKDDEKQEKSNRKKEKDAFLLCRQMIHTHNLSMKLLMAEYTFDNSRLLFYFSSEQRVDFRELVKDLASVFKTRIELRQIGVRDASKIMGGLGTCGRELCCHSYQSEFAPVSIRMAKEQSLSLNPTKISGMCGRLMCCLKHESDTYEYLNGLLPRIGAKVTTRSGVGGYVTAVNVLRQKVKVCIETADDKEMIEYPVSELKFTSRKGDTHAIEELEHVIDEYGEKVDLSVLSQLEDESELNALSADDDTGANVAADYTHGYAGKRKNKENTSDRNYKKPGRKSNKPQKPQKPQKENEDKALEDFAGEDIQIPGKPKPFKQKIPKTKNRNYNNNNSRQAQPINQSKNTTNNDNQRSEAAANESGKPKRIFSIKAKGPKTKEENVRIKPPQSSQEADTQKKQKPKNRSFRGRNNRPDKTD